MYHIRFGIFTLLQNLFVWPCV